jgi:hypothetical protein
MSNDDQNVGTVEQRLRLGPGLVDSDRQQLLEDLSPLNRHLKHWKPDKIDLRLSVRDRDYLDQRVTLEIWLPGRHTVLVHATDRDLERAVVEVRKAAIREIEDEADRR